MERWSKDGVKTNAYRRWVSHQIQSILTFAREYRLTFTFLYSLLSQRDRSYEVRFDLARVETKKHLTRKATQVWKMTISIGHFANGLAVNQRWNYMLIIFSCIARCIRCVARSIRSDEWFETSRTLSARARKYQMQKGLYRRYIVT